MESDNPLDPPLNGDNDGFQQQDHPIDDATIAAAPNNEPEQQHDDTHVETATVPLGTQADNGFNASLDTSQSNQIAGPITTAESDTVKQNDNVLDSSIDFTAIATFLQLDTKSLSSVSGVVLGKIQRKISEVSSLKSQNMILEVNLEQSTHLNNKKIDIFKSQLSSLKQEANELKQKNSVLESSKLDAEKKIAELEKEYSSSNSSSHESETKLRELSIEKRKTIELLEKRNQELHGFKSEFSKLQEANSKLRKELIELETSSQTANSKYLHTKLEVQSLETQFDILNKNNNWLNDELKSVNEDFAIYRKEKSTELSQLQSKLDSAVSELQSSRSTNENLSSRVDETSTRLDSSLLQIKSLKDELSSRKEEFFKEISMKDRLTNLLSKSNEDLKAKVSYLEDQLENSRSHVADESAVLKTALDKYKSRLDESEEKVKKLEESIDEMTKDPEISTQVSTPRAPVLSPSAKAVASKYPGLSLSQLYADFALLKKKLAQERRAKERMQQQIDTFVNELEQKAPLINATRERASQLENELTNLSIVLENTTRDKEATEKSYSELSHRIEESQTQIKVLHKQKTDLARQVQSLLIQVTIRDDSGGPLTPAEQDALNRIARGDRVVNESDTDRLISDRLVAFQNIADLQSKNEELLRITRELGAKLESEERSARTRIENLESVAINEAKEAILTLQDEIKSVGTKLDSVTRERDMFRSMLGNKNATNNDILGGVNNPSNGEEIVSLTKQLKDSQRELNTAYEDLKSVKHESETTISLLNRQINKLSNEKSELAVNLAKEQSSRSLTEERHKALQENLKYAKSETEELRKRTEILQEGLAKQDLRTQQVAEELIDTKSLLDSLRSESSNLKAEKSLWKSIEKRLTDENKLLLEERSNLNTLLVHVQNLEKEREANNKETQRRFIIQTETVESELTNLKLKLAENEKELKEISAKKDSAAFTYQEKIDDLRVELSSTREELVTKRSLAETLEIKVSSLAAELKLATSSLEEFRKFTQTGDSQSGLVSESIRLKTELSDTKSELEEANNSVFEFKNIAGAAEEALSSMNQTFDNYKETTNTKIADLESENKTLVERISVLENDINALNDEISKSKESAAKSMESAQLEINTLRGQVAQTDKLKEEYDSKIAAIESSYQEQVAIATDAQQNYDRELQKHASVSQAITLLREESNQLREKVQGLQTVADQAKSELEKSEKSWEDQKKILQEELRIARSKIDNLSSENKILYNSLNRKQDDSIADDEIDFDVSLIEGSNDELKELISLLRREKEISDTQLDISTRDLRRARQQLDIANNELDKTRMELVKAQSRDTDVERLSKEHTKLLEELNQLNLLRESNTTLRNELSNYIAKSNKLEAELGAANNKLVPIENRAAELSATSAQLEQQIRNLTEDRDRWRQRSQDILNKYERIDPEEHKKIKENVELLTKSLEEEKKRAADLAAKLNRLKTEAQEKLNNSKKYRENLTEKYNQVQKELTDLKSQNQAGTEVLSQKVEELEEKLKGANNKNQHEEENDSDKQISALRSELENTKSELQKAMEFETKFKEALDSKAQLEIKVVQLEEEVKESKSQLSQTSTNLEAGETSSIIAKLQEELSAQKSEFEKAKEAHEKEREALLKQNSDSLPKEEQKAVEEALQKQKEQLQAEFEAETAKKIAIGIENVKKKLRAPSEAKIKQIAEKRIETYKKASEEKLQKLEKDLQEKAESELNNRIKDLEKQFKEKPQNAESNAEFEQKITELKLEVEESKKQGFQEGREATLRETEMRSKLLKGKVDKLTKEKAELQEQLNSSTPAKKHEDVSLAPINPAASSTPIAREVTGTAGVKRPAEEEGGSQEKKSKSETANSGTQPEATESVKEQKE